MDLCLNSLYDCLLSSFVLSRYPHMSEEAIAEACPVCLGNCNCKACLRLEKVPVKVSLFFLCTSPGFLLVYYLSGSLTKSFMFCMVEVEESVGISHLQR